jgi:hypothetical protein
MASFPKDRFDDLPRDAARVGAHRAPKRRGRGWIAFAWAALATGVLVVGGLVVMERVFGIDNGITLWAPAATPTPTPTPTPTAEPITDPTLIDPALQLRVSILNASGTAGAQNTVGDQLAGGGWPVGSRVNAAEVEERTMVYYSDPSLEGLARGLVVVLGIGDIQLVDPATFPSQPLVVAVGSDYFAPAAEDAPEESTDG